MIKFRMDEDNPCTKDCAERHGGCHAICERYLKYHAKKQAEREARGAELEKMNVSTAAGKARSRRCQREEQKKARGNKS